MEVGELAGLLRGTSEGTSYGTRAWYVAGRIFLRLHERQGVLVVWCGDEHDKHSLLAEDDGVYFTSPHYDGYPSVLARLPVLNRA